MTDKVRMTYCGTPDYLAPEMINEEPQTEKLDVWTVGVIMYELIVGIGPFTPKIPYKSRREAMKALEYNILHSDPKFPSHVSIPARKLIKKFLEKKPENRLSCRDALRDDWFKKNGFFYKEEVGVLVSNWSKSSHHTLFDNVHRGKVTPIKPKVLDDDDDLFDEGIELNESAPSFTKSIKKNIGFKNDERKDLNRDEINYTECYLIEEVGSKNITPGKNEQVNSQVIFIYKIRTILKKIVKGLLLDIL